MGKRKYGARNEEFDLIQGLTIKEAAQMARENGGKIWEWAPEVVTAPGMVETGIDPYDEAYDTKADLRERLQTALRRSAEARHAAEEERKRHEDYQRQLIRGGLIPVEVLGKFLVQWDDEYSPSRMGKAVRLTFDVPTAQYPTPTDDAIRALANHGRNKNS